MATPNFFRNLLQTRRPELIAGVLSLCVVLALCRVLALRHFYVESENAVFQAYSTPLEAQVSGSVSRVFVAQNQRVVVGQLLCLLDERPQLYAWRKATAVSETALARREIAKRDLARAERLLRVRAVARADYDRTMAQSESADDKYRAALARELAAKTDWERTRVYAPSGGVIAFRSANPGEFVRAGQPLFGFVPDGERWVMAKVRETDLAGIKPGDEVEVSLDSVHGRGFVGKLESVGPSSEASFAALPDDFSAGNYTKFVQWVPVRVRLDLGVPDLWRIPVGVSSSVRLKRRG